MIFMYFGITGFDCGGEAVLKIIKFVMELLNLVFFLVPIILIVMSTVDFSKSVIASDEGGMKKNLSLFSKRVISCIGLFLVKPIVFASIHLLGNVGVDYAQCIEIAQNDDLSSYRISE